MDLGPLRTLACEVIQAAHGVAATVTRPAPDGTPVSTTGLWLTTPLEELRPHGLDFQRREPRRVMALPRRTFDSVPRGSLVSAPERLDGTPTDWRVDGIDQQDADYIRVILVTV